MSDHHMAILMGYYGAGNVGDELLFSIIQTWLNECGTEVGIVSYNEQLTQSLHGQMRTANVYNLLEQVLLLEQADLCVLGGGGIFQDHDIGLSPAELYRFPSRSMAQYAQNLLIARQFSIPTVCLAQGVGPLRSKGSRDVVADIFSTSEFVSVRDDVSCELLKDVGVLRDDISVAPDPVFSLFDDYDCPKYAVTDCRIGLVVRDWPFEHTWKKKLKDALNWMASYPEVTFRFINFAGDTDAAIIAELTRNIEPSRFEIINGFANPQNILETFKGLSGVLAMRLHAQIIAAGLGVPIVALEYDRKMSATSQLLDVHASSRLLLDAPAEIFIQTLHMLLNPQTQDLLRVERSIIQELASRSFKHRDLLQTAVKMSKQRRGTGHWTSNNFDWLANWFKQNDITAPVRPIDSLLMNRRREIAETTRRQDELESTRQELYSTRQLYTDACSHRDEALRRLQKLQRSVPWCVMAPLREAVKGVCESGRWLRRKLERSRTIAPSSQQAVNSVNPTASAAQAKNHLRHQRQLRQAEFLKYIRVQQKLKWPIFVQISPIDWAVPLYQRPQHTAVAISKLGAIVIYFEPHAKASPPLFHEVENNIWITHDKTILSDLHNCYVSIYSTDGSITTNHIDALSLHNIIIYEYVDHIDPAISGDNAIPILLRTKEHCFSGGVDLVAASAKQLYDEAVATVDTDRVILVPNGVDYWQYQAVKPDNLHIMPQLVAFKERYPLLIGYFGALAPWLWYDVINELTLKRQDLGFVFIGPDYNGGMEQLVRRDNILLTGAIPNQALPYHANHFDVCTIPFSPGKIAQTTSPLKLFEYFALGKPVVVTSDMVECMQYPEVLGAGNTFEFSSAIDRCLSLRHSDDFLKKLHHRALENTWDARAMHMLTAARQLLSTKSSACV